MKRSVFIILFLLFLSILTYAQSKKQYADKTIGVCLSGGGAIGFAHLGALQALEENGIYPTHLSGTSIGSILGIMYASGYTPQEIFQIIKKEKMYKISYFFKPRLTNHKGFSRLTKIRKIYDKYISHSHFDSLKLSMSICCVNINEGKDTCINTGEQLRDFTFASLSVPFFYEYVTINEKNYVDGAIINNFPIEPLVAAHCDMIIGINVVHFSYLPTSPSKWEILPAAYALINESMNKERFALCDYYVSLEGFNNVDYFVFSYKKYKEIYEIGYEEMKRYIKEHIMVE